MSSSEEQALRDKIRALSGRIQQHKRAQQQGALHDYHAGRGAYHRSAPYPQPAYRGGYRGSRGRYPTSHHRSLVHNGADRNQQPSDANTTHDASDPASTYVTNNLRNLQLVRKDIYDQESQERAQLAKQIQDPELQVNSFREQAQGARTLHLHGAKPATGSVTASTGTRPAKPYEVEIDSVRFHVAKKGSKLIKAPDDYNPPSATPKVAFLGGVKFCRTKNGNLVRNDVVKAHRNVHGFKRVNEICNDFSWTGHCAKGSRCHYIHDSTKTAICKKYLVKGECPRGDKCDLSHEPTEERTPLCIHFEVGNCNNPSCVYLHVQHPADAPICRAFGTKGYCEKGAGCDGRHVYECPDFGNTGKCKVRGCKRPHIERASIMRLAAAKQDENDDVSSNDESVDTDDVDSDDVEEFIGQDDDDFLDFAQQKDFIAFA
ncbi:hypothetical protein F5Y18DRAFT_374082 [Xylariaceae sp. FL1019]|nr:hypothetical protein F5Y18DRAFT_374082 [Xylariaceae sp. FL1019]